MLLIFLISFLSVILVSNPILHPFLTAQEFRKRVAISRILGFLNGRTSMKKTKNEEQEKEVIKEEEEINEEVFPLLDLPDLPLECILEKTSPSGLCTMASVCTSLRDWCTSDHLWEKHLKQKFGRLISDASYQHWQKHISSRKRAVKPTGNQWQKKIFGYFSKFWFGSCNVAKTEEKQSSLPEDSIKAWYLAIESGKFWLPAQIFNREHGQVGFMMSCYDAEVSYDSSADNFVARYSANGRRIIEDNIGWNRLRAPATIAPPDVLHISDCLNDLRPGDQIEIQWRRNKDFPYGWWYGVVGHLESCNGNASYCKCIRSDTVVLEFKQYAVGSRWRQTVISRKDHREVGNGGDGFYGGIRKLNNEVEISMWKSFWPSTTLE